MKKKCLFLVGLVICIILSGLCFFVGFKPFFEKPKTDDFAPVRPTKAPQIIDATADEKKNTDSDDVKCPVDFESLNDINSDIYAWLDVPGTNISYPVLQNENDDTFYLNHNSDKEYSSNGAIFSEHKYNSKSFTDPITVLYGHDMMSGKMFGELQEDYSNYDFLKENNEIIVYTPNEELHYKIFASTPYYSMHLLHYYDFQKSYVFNQFFDELYNYRTMSSIYLQDEKPNSGDKVLVLSTCMNTGENKRYLVMGVLNFSIKYK